MFPEPVDEHAGGQRIVAIHQPLCQTYSRSALGKRCHLEKTGYIWLHHVACFIHPVAAWENTRLLRFGGNRGEHGGNRLEKIVTLGKCLFVRLIFLFRLVVQSLAGPSQLRLELCESVRLIFIRHAQHLAPAAGLCAGIVAKLLDVCEERSELVKVTTREWIKLVIVTLGATKRGAEPGSGGGAHAVGGVLDSVLGVLNPALGTLHVESVE